MKTIRVNSEGEVIFDGKKYHCLLGRGGVRADKVEGDGATPAGCFLLRRVFYRSDKFESQPATSLPTQPLTENDGWSDDVSLPEYNTHIQLPYEGSHERLWRNDDIYDVVVNIGHNDDPPIPGSGSAIFIHIARSGYTPTDGCIAFSKKDLLEILETCDTETQICIDA